MKSLLSKIFASFVVAGIKKDSKNALQRQKECMDALIEKGRHCKFGKDHSFDEIVDYSDFKERVPIRDYEDFKNYIEDVKAAKENILWPGKPLYLSKTSGTTSGAKYIPITSDSISNHINSARNALLCYINETGNADFVNGKMIFLQGSPELDEINGIKTGRLSGIVAHHVPRYLLKNRVPSFEVNCIDDWEKKVEAVTEETLKEDMRLISGIPPWVQMYFESLKKKSGKEKIKDIFPNFSLMVYGGVNYKPYEKSINEVIGKKIDQIELYPASEGFIAYQDRQNEEGMLLNVNSGIFFEFIKADDFFIENRERICLDDVQLGVNYALILSNNAGLWAYNIGDTVKFVSLDPHRIVVTGRIKHFISAFGEHVIAEEVEDAVNKAIDDLNVEIHEFHVAPQVNPNNGELPYHEWFIEFESESQGDEKLIELLDTYLQKRNTYYKDLREGNIMQKLKVTTVKKNAFNDYMKSVGKLGGQNKLPRLSNDRNIADAMQQFIV